MDWEAFYNAFRSPDFIPGFEIEYRLGGGAFGDVYKARRTSIGKPYAIKFLKVEDEDHRVAVERELDQVRHFAAIDHPNLVSIEDLGLALGVPYVIMGYAGDETLAKRMRAGDLTALEALRVFTQAARGVLALHEHQLVHFDLKPSNIFLHGEQARVGDYGLSKLLDGGRMTLSYGRGTPMYMAPEILRSRADHRADLYSLGVILYESLTGRVPYAPEEIGGLVLRDSDEPPSFPPEFPAAARRVCEACLRLDPVDRAQSAAEVLDLLGQSARPGDDVEFDLTPDAAARTAPAPARSGATPTAAAAPRGGTLSKGVGSAGLVDASSRLMEGGIRVDSPDGAGDSASDPSSRASSGTPGAQAMALVAELRARREAEARLGAPAAPRLEVVPVPPKVTGGLGSTLFETTRVAFDVFIASIAGVVSTIALAFRWVSDRLVRRTGGGFVARAARFALFLLLMATVGFGATLLGLVGLFLSSAAR